MNPKKVLNNIWDCIKVICMYFILLVITMFTFWPIFAIVAIVCCIFWWLAPFIAWGILTLWAVFVLLYLLWAYIDSVPSVVN